MSSLLKRSYCNYQKEKRLYAKELSKASQRYPRQMVKDKYPGKNKTT